MDRKVQIKSAVYFRNISNGAETSKKEDSVMIAALISAKWKSDRKDWASFGLSISKIIFEILQEQMFVFFR